VPEGVGRVRHRTFGLLATCLFVGGCAGGPWFLGAPRPGVAVPADDRNPDLARLHATRRRALAAGEGWAELPVLRRLAAKGALERPEQARLQALLETRLALWTRRGRARAAWRVTWELAQLSPSTVDGPALTASAVRAAASWRALGSAREAAAVLGDAQAWLEARGELAEVAHLARARREIAEPSAPRGLALPDLTDVPPSPFPETLLTSAVPAGEALLTDSLTEAIERGGTSLVLALARRPDAEILAEILRDEDPTAPMTWESLAVLWFAAGRADAARRALVLAASYDERPQRGWTRAAQLADAARDKWACEAWHRAAAVSGQPWDPRWPRFLQCLAPEAGPWLAYLVTQVPPSQRSDYARWLAQAAL